MRATFWRVSITARAAIFATVVVLPTPVGPTSAITRRRFSASHGARPGAMRSDSAFLSADLSACGCKLGALVTAWRTHSSASASSTPRCTSIESSSVAGGGSLRSRSIFTCVLMRRISVRSASTDERRLVSSSLA